MPEYFRRGELCSPGYESGYVYDKDMLDMNKGYFFTFEGIDGCGKSTQLSRVAEALRARGHTCAVTREPGGPAISERIREILISPDNAAMFPETELLLYLAARAQHVRETIRPALDRGEIVLCDRFEQATFAYQGYGRGLDMERLRFVNGFAADGVTPDVTFVFDIPVFVSTERLGRIGKGKDRIESAGTEFFERVRRGYLAAAADSEGVCLLDGTKDIDELTALVLARIDKAVVAVSSP